MTGGLVLGALGLAWFTQVGVHTGYLGHVLPAELIVSFGLGLVFVPLNSTALIGVAPADAGVASAMVNTTQQVGGSLGTALLNTLAASATASYLAIHGYGAEARASALVHGYTTAFTLSAALVAAAAVVTVCLIRTKANQPVAVEDAPAAAPAAVAAAAALEGGPDSRWGRGHSKKVPNLPRLMIATSRNLDRRQVCNEIQIPPPRDVISRGRLRVFYRPSRSRRMIPPCSTISPYSAPICVLVRPSTTASLLPWGELGPWTSGTSSATASPGGRLSGWGR